jgi:hypothetical protein
MLSEPESNLLSDYWAKNYPDSPPIAHRLREVLRNRWVRFHSLPESKRYAESEDEYLTILQRHNDVLGHLAFPAENLTLVSASYSDVNPPIRENQQLNELDPGAAFWQTITDPDDTGPPLGYHLFVSTWHWSPGIFDAILRLVADWHIADLMILGMNSAWVYHPYDGGADVILPSTAARDQLKAKFRPWCSKRADGL